MKPKEIKCEDCKASCCRVFGIYELTPEDKIRIPASLWAECDLYPGGALMKTRGFICDALDQGSNRCARYKIRPSICRRFAPGSTLCMLARAEHARQEALAGGSYE